MVPHDRFAVADACDWLDVDQVRALEEPQNPMPLTASPTAEAEIQIQRILIHPRLIVCCISDRHYQLWSDMSQRLGEAREREPIAS